MFDEKAGSLQEDSQFKQLFELPKFRRNASNQLVVIQLPKQVNSVTEQNKICNDINIRQPPNHERILTSSLALTYFQARVELVQLVCCHEDTWGALKKIYYITMGGAIITTHKTRFPS